MVIWYLVTAALSLIGTLLALEPPERSRIPVRIRRGRRRR
jgi:hypothetical protein